MTGKSHKMMSLSLLLLTVAVLHGAWATNTSHAQGTIPVVMASPAVPEMPPANTELLTETADATVDVGPTPSLMVRNTIGSITVTRSAEDAQIIIHITKQATTDTALRQKMFTITRNGDAVMLADENPSGGISVRNSAELAMLPSADIEIALPYQANLTIRNNQGAVAISGIAGTVDATTNTGEIRLNGGSGSITLKSTVGPITVRDFIGSANLHTTDGDITIAGTFTDEMPNQLQTTRGNITFVGALAQTSHTEVQTNGGNITFSLPPQSAFTFTIATTASNNISVDFAFMGTYVDQPRFMLSGVVGDPNAALIIRQTSGTIKITPQT